MSARLFHTIVLAGASFGMACATAHCGGAVEPPRAGPADGGEDGADAGTTSSDAGEVDTSDAHADAETWPTISFDARPYDSADDNSDDGWSHIAPNMDAFHGDATPEIGWPPIPAALTDAPSPDTGWAPIMPPPRKGG